MLTVRPVRTTTRCQYGAGVMIGYDVIGDVHGHADHLQGLLATMGYTTGR